MVLMVAHLSGPLSSHLQGASSLILIGGFNIILMVAYLSWLLALSFIEGRWSDCDWGIQNDVDGCPSVLAPFSLIHRG